MKKTSKNILMIMGIAIIIFTATAVANKAVETAAEHTTSGRFIITYDNVSMLIRKSDFIHYFDLIAAEIAGREEVKGLSTINYELDMVLGLDWCPQVEAPESEKQRAEAKNVKPLMSPPQTIAFLQTRITDNSRFDMGEEAAIICQQCGKRAFYPYGNKKTKNIICTGAFSFPLPMTAQRTSIKCTCTEK